eukprot:362927-Chlamydomonas_euryale.AAC.3
MNLASSSVACSPLLKRAGSSAAAAACSGVAMLLYCTALRPSAFLPLCEVNLDEQGGAAPARPESNATAGSSYRSQTQRIHQQVRVRAPRRAREGRPAMLCCCRHSERCVLFENKQSSSRPRSYSVSQKIRCFAVRRCRGGPRTASTPARRVRRGGGVGAGDSCAPARLRKGPVSGGQGRHASMRVQRSQLNPFTNTPSRSSVLLMRPLARKRAAEANGMPASLREG